MPSLTTHPEWRWPDEPITVIHEHHGPGLLTTRGAFYGYNAQRTYEPDARDACRPDYSKPGTRAAVWAAHRPGRDHRGPFMTPSLYQFDSAMRLQLDTLQKEQP